MPLLSGVTLDYRHYYVIWGCVSSQRGITLFFPSFFLAFFFSFFSKYAVDISFFTCRLFFFFYYICFLNKWYQFISSQCFWVLFWMFSDWKESNTKHRFYNNNAILHHHQSSFRILFNWYTHVTLPMCWPINMVWKGNDVILNCCVTEK